MKKKHSQSARKTIFVAEAKVRRYLSGVFNLQELEDANRFILVDDFGYDIYEKQESARQLTIARHKTTPISFIVADKNFVQWYDRLNVEYEFKNGFTLNINTFVHIWQMISVSPFANAVCYIDKTINTAVATTPNVPFEANGGDNKEYEFVDVSGNQVYLNDLSELHITHIDENGFAKLGLPLNVTPTLEVTTTKALNIKVPTGLASGDWKSIIIQFGNAVVTVNNAT